MSYMEFVKDLKFRPTELSDVLKDSLKKKNFTTSDREVKLRASSMPTCSLLLLHQMYVGQEEDSAMMDYYCSVGTTVHQHLQKWLGRSGKIFGDWYCAPCNHKVYRSFNNSCPKCSQEMEYVELELEYHDFSGHVDGLFQKNDGTFLVFDYKTSSIESVRNKKFLPVKKHLVQLSSYGAILKKVLKLDVSEISVLYLARDNPNFFAEFNRPFTDDLYAYSLDFIRSQIKAFRAAKKSLETNNPEYAIKYKLCQSYHDYKEEYEPLLGFDGCPFAKMCFNKHNTIQYFSSLINEE